jgi:hypothetical protein
VSGTLSRKGVTFPPSEFHSSMDVGLRMANADMLRWLTTEYKLTAPEANLLIGTVVQHKIVTYVGTMATLISR